MKDAEELIDRAYVLGYEQATREWSACLSDSTLYPDKSIITNADVKRRYEAARMVRKLRGKV